MMKLLHIVRRYGPVGGMERYVWELTRELAAMGHEVTVLCETLEADPADASDINIVELGSIRSKPRWLAHLRFSHKVSQWVATHPDANRIIHSHERTAVHQITTFHGPPFALVRNKPLWKRLSPRIYANLWLEKRELCGPQVKAVIPNSPMIAASLLEFYPELGSTLVEPVVPGVGDIPTRAPRTVSESGGVIGFVGKEWKRKGLDIAVAIVAQLRLRRPDLEFVVAGPKPKEVRFLFNGWDGGYTLLGEADATQLYAGFDLLLHPARQEPYGMVIAEARAAAVPVLVSDLCGISAELDAVQVMSLASDHIEWSYACEQMLTHQPERVIHSWHDVATEQIKCYRQTL